MDRIVTDPHEPFLLSQGIRVGACALHGPDAGIEAIAVAADPPGAR